MKVLAITNMYPTPEAPVSGVFVEQQIKGLLSVGVEVRVLFIDRRREGALSYYRMGPQVRRAVAEFNPDLIHVMYGGVMADQITRKTRLHLQLRFLKTVCVVTRSLSRSGGKSASVRQRYVRRRLASRK